MDYALIAVAGFFVSLLTFFSGFGLGTLLLPVFVLFLPIELAVAATAVVHLANNLFKAALVGRNANKAVLLRFIIPAAIFAMLGAWLLVRMTALAPLHTYMLGEREIDITVIKLVIAVLMIIFALFDLIPGMDKLAFPKNWIPFGGALSGFVGGLSGHQGALRTAVLIRLGLSKEAFIGTSVLCAVVVDVFRLSVYGTTFLKTTANAWETSNMGQLVLTGIIAAFAGSFLGKKVLHKITLKGLHIFIGWMILVMAVALGAGLV